MSLIEQFHLRSGRVIQYDESHEYDVRFEDGTVLKNVLEELARLYEEHGRESKLTVMVTIRDKQGEGDSGRNAEPEPGAPRGRGLSHRVVSRGFNPNPNANANPSSRSGG